MLGASSRAHSCPAVAWILSLTIIPSITGLHWPGKEGHKGEEPSDMCTEEAWALADTPRMAHGVERWWSMSSSITQNNRKWARQESQSNKMVWAALADADEKSRVRAAGAGFTWATGPPGPFPPPPSSPKVTGSSCIPLELQHGGYLLHLRPTGQTNPPWWVSHVLRILRPGC